MPQHSNVPARRFLRAICGLILSAAAGLGFAQAPIVQPGAPGDQSRLLGAEEAIELAHTSYTRADVQFVQNMIPHHYQAIEMAALVSDRTNRQELLDAASRIDASQADEIELMQSWLRQRGEDVPDPTENHAMHTSRKMAGMATPEQMAALAAARGTEFDRLFLELMITHHEGALTMVEDLLDQPGSAYEPALFEFTTDVTNDQTAEIERMSALLASISTDPRAGLEAGFEDAGQAMLNMELVASLPKPPGFYDPENPAGLPPKRLAELAGDAGPKETDQAKEPDQERAAGGGARAAEEAAAGGASVADEEGGADESAVAGEEAVADEEGVANGEADADEEAVADGEAVADEEAASGEEAADEEDGDRGNDRRPLLTFANTDIAFRGDVMVVGNYHGFNVYRLGEDGVPKLLSSVVCPGGQGDVSIVGDLLLMSVEQTRGRIDCGLQGAGGDVSPERFRGLRIFDIGDLTRPVQVGQVQTCRGSHTHSVVSADDRRIVVYNSGTSSVRDEEELRGCIGEVAGDTRTALFRIDVIEIPVDDPSKARIVDSPAVFADPETGILAGLWRGGDHGDDTQETHATDQCHDITVFPALEIAAGACSGNGIVFDIADPLHPERIDAVIDSGFAYWHSATFNNDGTKVLFTDEWGGGSRPRCRAHDPLSWGADAIYDIVAGKLEYRSHYKLSAPQADTENCVAHNGSIVPVPGRDIMVQAWYQGGISVIDFTDSAHPVEIAFFDRGPIDAEELVVGGFWSAYWYKGKIYATEIVRGIDVLALVPSEFLTENEIAAAAVADQGPVFNPQQQFRVTWPAEPVVAQAYIDQLRRSDALAPPAIEELTRALDLAESRIESGAGDETLAASLESLADGLREGDAGDAAAGKRKAGLAETLSGLAARLR